VLRGRRLLFGPGLHVEVEKIEVPDPGPHEVLVQVTRTQVSAGSEMNFIRHGAAGYGLPAGSPERVPIGYMAVGRVAALGAGVEDYTTGERVLSGGTHGSHWLVDLDNPNAYLEKVPDGVSDEAAGFAVLGDVALHGVRRAALQIDESVAVFGMGMVGQLTLQLARLSGGYPLIAVDIADARLEKARLSGATHVVNAARDDPARAIREITGGAGAETIFHCTQVAGILQNLLEAAADRGTIVLTGSAPGTAQIGLQAELLRHELTIVGIYEAAMNQPHAYWPWTRRRNRRACLRLINEAQLRMDQLITHVVPPEQAQAVFEMMLRGSEDWLGVVFAWA
jgi:threonine dehydrogenase-like Zn-dependent dehydrogenase